MAIFPFIMTSFESGEGGGKFIFSVHQSWQAFKAVTGHMCKLFSYLVRVQYWLPKLYYFVLMHAQESILCEVSWPSYS